MANVDPVEQIIRLFRERGDAAYIGEAVSQTEHALQTAQRAEQAGFPAPWIVAAFLHDVGHLLHDLPEDCVDSGIDDTHEQRGAKWLGQHFGPDVSDQVRLHVSAKRYLCSTDSSYVSQLSEASLKSLRLQGGPFNPKEAEAFRRHPQAEAAVALRRLDDEAKIPGLPTPSLEHYRSILEACLVTPCT